MGVELLEEFLLQQVQPNVMDEGDQPTLDVRPVLVLIRNYRDPAMTRHPITACPGHLTQ